MSRCIFCGGSPTTNAHIFRRGWLEQIFPGLGRLGHRHQRRGRDGFDRSWSKDEADIKVGCACAQRNGGWMDQLDHEAEAVFATAAAIGLPAKIASQADQRTVARWSTLIAILADQTQSRPVVESEAHRALAAGGIPEGTHVWLLKTEPPQWQAHGWLEPRELLLGRADGPTPPNAYFITFGINHLVIQVFIPTSRTPPVDLDRTANAASVRQLQPSPLTPVIYPPPQTVPWEELTEVVNAFHTPQATGAR